jgi:DNA-binding CsgD family transcriptional regulator
LLGRLWFDALFIGAAAMGIRRTSKPPSLVIPPDTFPIEADAWQRVIKALQLPPQQARVAEQLLYGRQDKEIVAVLDIRPPTLRTHLHRLLIRVDAADRTQLAVRLIAAVRLLDRAAAKASSESMTSELPNVIRAVQKRLPETVAREID